MVGASKFIMVVRKGWLTSDLWLAMTNGQSMGENLIGNVKRFMVVHNG